MRFINYVLSLFPSKLPVAMPEFERFADSIIDLSGEYADRKSMKWAVAAMIMHLGPQRSKVPKNYFVRSLRKTAANQVAQEYFRVIKEEQLTAQKAAEEANKTIADTTSPESTTTDGTESQKV